MSNRILDYPEATEITSNDYILLDNEGTGAKCIKASALNINMDNYTIKEARGAIASFDDGEDLPLAFMGAYITAIQEGSGDPSPSNIRPIIGWDEANVTRTGKNLVNWKWNTFNDGKMEIFLKSGTYTLSAESTLTNGNAYIRGTKPSGGYVSREELGLTNWGASSTSGVYYGGGGQQTYTFNIPNGGAKIEFGKLNNNGTISAQLEIGSTATTYEPYNGNTYSLTFTDGSNPLTVYGGTVDLVSGVLTVDRAYVDMGTLNWVYESDATRFRASLTDVNTDSRKLISSIYHYSQNPIGAHNQDLCMCPYAYGGVPSIFCTNFSYTDSPTFKTAMNGVQLVYELATPLTYQLSKQQIRSLVGENNFFANTGDSIVDYRKRWVKPEM